MGASTIKLLGKPAVDIDGQASPIVSSAKGLALLAYLVLTQQAHTREAVADLLWETASTAKSLNNLRQLLSRLRGWLPDLRISASDVAYVATGWVDVYMLAAGLATDDLAAVDAALTLYEGELLAGLYLPDAPRFDEWLTLEREHLRQRVVGAYQQLCVAYAEQEAWVKGLAAAQRWLILDDFDETALQYVLQFLAAGGQIGAALRQYEVSKQRLWAELEVEPAPETVQLAQRLQRLKEEQGGGLSWAAIVGAQLERPLPDQLAEPGALPHGALVPYLRNNDFAGRRESLLHLASLLLPEEAARMRRAVAITGMGGLGKTQLAVEFCYRYGRYFPGGVYWLSFADADNVAADIAAIGGERGMGLYREADKLALADKVGRVTKAWQDAIPRLLIFDNCEYETLLARWLPVSGGCSVLLTSRRAHWARELQVAEWPLPVLDAHESLRLLRNLAPALGADEADAIAAELGHLPLALHLAGSFLRRYRQITAEHYLAQLRDTTLLAHPSLQGRGAAFSPTGHELDVARTFAVNWEQLDDADQTDAMARTLLACAAHFAPGEPLPRDLLLAAVVTDETDVMQLLLAEDGLARLISLGFVRANGETTLSMHRLVAAFVQTMAPDAAAGTAVADAIWQRIKRQWETGTVLDQLAVAPTQVQYVMDVEFAKATLPGVHLAHAWGRHLMDSGDFARARLYYEKALTLCETVYGVEQPEAADILIDLGTVTWKSDSNQAAWPHYRRALAIYEQTFGAVHFKTANGLATTAILHARTGDYPAAIANYQRALSIYEQVLPPDHQIVGLTLYNVAVAYRRLGQYQLALSHYEVSLRIRRTMWSDDNPHILTLLSSIGVIRFLIGDYQAAYEYFRQALTGRQERLGDQHHHTALSLAHVGVALGFLGNYEAAIGHLQQALEIREKAFGGAHPQLVYTLTYLGVMLQKVGETENARTMLERGLAIQEARQIGDEQTAETLTYLADVLMQVGEDGIAYDHLVRAVTIWEQGLGVAHSKTAATLIRLGEWHERGGDGQTAQIYYQQALTILANEVVPTHVELIRVQAHVQQRAVGA